MTTRITAAIEAGARDGAARRQRRANTHFDQPAYQQVTYQVDAYLDVLAFTIIAPIGGLLTPPEGPVQLVLAREDRTCIDGEEADRLNAYLKAHHEARTDPGTPQIVRLADAADLTEARFYDQPEELFTAAYATVDAPAGDASKERDMGMQRLLRAVTETDRDR